MKIKPFLYLLSTIYYLTACQSSSLDDYRLWELNQELENSLEAYRDESESLLAQFKKEVEKAGNLAEDRAEIHQLEDFKQQASRLIGVIDSLKINLKTKADHQLAATSQVRRLLLGEDGKQLATKLDSFQHYLSHKFQYLELKKADFAPLIDTRQDFAQKYFAHINLAEALVLLTEKQLQIVKNEHIILRKIQKNMPEKITPLISVRNNQPKLGTWYETEVILLRLNEQKNPFRMKVNGQNIPVDKYGIGKVKFKPEGVGKQTLKMEIKVKNRGRDTTFTLEKRYYIIPK
jgi:hypothetical protein